MNDIALQVHNDEALGRFLVLSASEVSVDEIVRLGRLLEAVE